MKQSTSQLRPVLGKSMTDLRREWDQVAELRLDQIEHGRDLSFSYVLEPAILGLVDECDRSSVLDIGCGIGILTCRLAEISEEVLGVDFSAESIRLAKKRPESRRHNLQFLDTSVEALAERPSKRFSVIVANMVLMTMLDLPPALRAVSSLLRPEGHFIFTITHPCFWPTYWQYDKEDWFDYSSEIAIEAPFRISADGPSDFITTHVHRPLEQYFAEICRAGLSVVSVLEPKPHKELNPAYIRTWHFPRFLAMKCVLR